jgi:hypothetical protein
MPPAAPDIAKLQLELREVREIETTKMHLPHCSAIASKELKLLVNKKWTERVCPGYLT